MPFGSYLLNSTANSAQFEWALIERESKTQNYWQKELWCLLYLIQIFGRAPNTTLPRSCRDLRQKRKYCRRKEKMPGSRELDQETYFQLVKESRVPTEALKNDLNPRASCGPWTGPGWTPEWTSYWTRKTVLEAVNLILFLKEGYILMTQILQGKITKIVVFKEN